MGKTIIFVSHDLSSVSKYCDRVVLLNQGVKLGEGSPKEMIDDYKRVLVGQYELRSPSQRAVCSMMNRSGSRAEKGCQTGHLQVIGIWYKEAVIEQFYMTDDRGYRVQIHYQGFGVYDSHESALHGRSARTNLCFFHQDSKGTEITGTNTMFEKAFLEPVKAGAVKDITFTQKMSLQGGEILLSFGVTGYDGNDLQVYHRLYDALDLTVISDKNTVGFYDMDSKSW